MPVELKLSESVLNSINDYTPLRLMAVSEEDLDVIAACLQDALIPVGGMVFDPESRQFHLVAHRFCWECPEEPHRVLSHLTFSHVQAVHKRDLSVGVGEEMLNLLTLQTLEENGPLHLVFSGGAEVRIMADQLTCHLTDLEEPHPATRVPEHTLS